MPNSASSGSMAHDSSNRRMGLRAMLNTLIAIALAAAVGISGLSFWGSQASGIAATQSFVTKDVTADILPPPLYLIEMRLVLSQAVEGNMPIAAAQTEFKRLQTEYKDRAEYWRSHPPYGLESKLLGAQHQEGQAFMLLADKTLELVASGATPDAIQASLKAAQASYVAHRAGVDATVKESVSLADQSIANYESTTRDMRRLQAIGLALTAVLLVAFGFWIRRSVWSDVGGEPVVAARVARTVAQGNLSVSIPLLLGDQRSIVAALKEMQTRLAAVVGSVRQGADEVATASAEIAQGNHHLSSRTEQQASALEETTAAMEELLSMVTQNADSAEKANQQALHASKVAVEGGAVVAQAVDTMKGINDASHKIADIIGVIDGIAFQTNILALNAAVEAARAGEQGRGFAVVASEVRALAGRSADAAKEIKSLINTSVERVDKGTALVDQAGITMTEVVKSIRCVTDTMAEINASSHGQASGFAQVGEAMAQMDQATQKNAALVEEMAAAASSLKSQANELVQIVAIFKLDEAIYQTRAAVSQPEKPAPVRAAFSAPILSPVQHLALETKLRA